MSHLKAAFNWSLSSIYFYSNDVRYFLSSNSKILFIISQASNVNLPIIYKYDFDNQSLTLKFQTIGSFSGYGHGSIMLNDSQLFMLIFDSTTSGNLYFNKIIIKNKIKIIHFLISKIFLISTNLFSSNLNFSKQGSYLKD